jgi:hypothetical protein
VTNDVGDIATLTLTVTPFDNTTTATVSVTSPTGTVTSPSTTPSSDRSTWTAQLPLTEPGEYLVRWSVTGVGAGVEQSTVTARPTQPTIFAGDRAYATTADLAVYLNATPPSDARRMLQRASERIDDMLLTAIYDVDTNHLPTDLTVRAALRNAVCAQVKWWLDTGDESGAMGVMQSVSIGSVSLGRGYTGAGSATGAAQNISSDAVMHLRRAGLLSNSPLGFDGRAY